MVTVINPVSHSEAIKQNWKLLHSINILALVTAVPLWFVTPFLTRNPESNGWHKFFRFTSIGYAIAVGSTSLYFSNQLGKMKPKIDAMNKREIAEFKHTIASDLFLAQGTNSAIAQFVLTERQSSLTPVTEFPESSEVELSDPSVHRQFPKSSESSESSGNSELSKGTERERNLELFMEPVLEALENGLKDSDIIKDVMGFKGRRYADGKVILNDIKSYLDLEEG
ncbi:conserved hypothetical protein [Planktothrix serta PCC 8927]|uniref:Uncharacterized protein n=1 Tax=Planktothrix serta PCC 8927 TaxID=671068 RepID=A0A7Z9BZF7_9CYAN|nr:hypothetical protein [Planktothrix serta]VXD22390.1 conserved hypothetical protein [Planktothrix serta PCC 8927]